MTGWLDHILFIWPQFSTHNSIQFFDENWSRIDHSLGSYHNSSDRNRVFPRSLSWRYVNYSALYRRRYYSRNPPVIICVSFLHLYIESVIPLHLPRWFFIENACKVFLSLPNIISYFWRHRIFFASIFRFCRRSEFLFFFMNHHSVPPMKVTCTYRTRKLHSRIA